MLNLLLYAQQAMTDGGQLTVRTRTTPYGAALDLIFTAFYSIKPGGSGLGLATTRKIIDAHRGRIAVQSEVGRGTQFTIELPVPPRLAAK